MFGVVGVKVIARYQIKHVFVNQDILDDVKLGDGFLGHSVFGRNKVKRVVGAVQNEFVRGGEEPFRDATAILVFDLRYDALVIQNEKLLSVWTMALFPAVKKWVISVMGKLLVELLV